MRKIMQGFAVLLVLSCSFPIYAHRDKSDTHRHRLDPYCERNFFDITKLRERASGHVSRSWVLNLTRQLDEVQKQQNMQIGALKISQLALGGVFAIFGAVVGFWMWSKREKKEKL